MWFLVSVDFSGMFGCLDGEHLDVLVLMCWMFQSSPSDLCMLYGGTDGELRI
jgi:hypothetical protein